MTAIAPEKPGRPRVQDIPARVGSWVRQQPARLRDRAGDVRDALIKPRATLLNDEDIRLRAVQSLYWSVLLGLVFAQIAFGVYDAVLQVAWVPGHSLKAAWDADGFGLVKSGNWPRYRHLAFRDVAGPAWGTMGVVTVLAKPKWWDKGKDVKTFRLVTAPLVIILLTYALGVLGVYLAYYGLPDAWHHLWGSYTLPDTKWLGYLSADNFVIGFAIAHILRRYWAPVGAALQGSAMDRSVNHWQARATRNGKTLRQAVADGMLPAWERLPLAPPVLRERFAKTWRENTRLRVRVSRKWVTRIVLVIMVLLAILVAIGHYVAGHGIPVPYLFPGH
jgi:hypothetical protein